MNTEAIKTLKQVREVISQMQLLLNDKSLNEDERRLTEQIISNLLEVEDVIIMETLQAMVDKLNVSNTKLQELNCQMEESTIKMAKLSETVKKVSDVIGVLAEITAKAITAGIA